MKKFVSFLIVLSLVSLRGCLVILPTPIDQNNKQNIQISITESETESIDKVDSVIL